VKINLIEEEFVNGMYKYPMQYLLVEIILAIIGIVYQNKNKPAKPQNYASFASNFSAPDIYVVNVNQNNVTPVVNQNQIYNQSIGGGNPASQQLYQPPYYPQQASQQPQQSYPQPQNPDIY